MSVCVSAFISRTSTLACSFFQPQKQCRQEEEVLTRMTQTVSVSNSSVGIRHQSWRLHRSVSTSSCNRAASPFSSWMFVSFQGSTCFSCWFHKLNRKLVSIKLIIVPIFMLHRLILMPEDELNLIFLIVPWSAERTTTNLLFFKFWFISTQQSFSSSLLLWFRFSLHFPRKTSVLWVWDCNCAMWAFRWSQWLESNEEIQPKQKNKFFGPLQLNRTFLHSGSGLRSVQRRVLVWK